MHKYITRTLFALAMLSLTLNNGIDIWRKLKPVELTEVVPVPVPDVQRVQQDPVVAAPVIPAAVAQQMAQPIPVVMPVAAIKDGSVPGDQPIVMASEFVETKRSELSGCGPNDWRCKLRSSGLMPAWRPGIDYKAIYEKLKAEGRFK